jgi:tRNA A-37 threonylcarbamoyl transferase component Bud32
MPLEEIIRKKAEQKIQKYYPDEAFVIKDIKEIKTVAVYRIEGRKIIRKPTTALFRLDLESDKSKRTFFVKIFRDGRKAGVLQFKKLGAENFRCPRILDYWDDVKALVIEKAAGRILSYLLLIYTLPILYNRKRALLLHYMSEIGSAIGTLHSKTYRGERQLGKLKLYASEDLNLSPTLEKVIGQKLFEMLACKVTQIKAERAAVSQTHRDLTLHNIFVHDKLLNIIDFSFDYDFCFIDVAIFLMKLELVYYRLPWASKRVFEELKWAFLAAYTAVAPPRPDPELEAFLWFLRYCFELKCYEQKRTHKLRQIITNWLEKRFLTKQIKVLAKEIF